MNASTDWRDQLLEALKIYDICVLEAGETLISIEKEYIVEIETNGVFKLLWKGKVVAPFRDLDEMCQFIQMS